MTIKAIHGAFVPGAPDERVVDLLEGYLKEAKAGNLRSVAVVGVTTDGTVTTAWRHNSDLFTMVGGVAWLQQRLVNTED